MPWPELRSEERCCRLCSASSLQHLFEGGPATPETIPTIWRHFLLPHRPRRICSILGPLATKPQEEGKAAMSHLWETPRTFLRTRAGRHAGWGGTICSSITTWLLSVGEAPATIGLPRLQRTPLCLHHSSGPFKIWRPRPLLSGALALGVSPLLISRPSSLVSSSSLPFPTHYPKMAQSEVWRAWSPEDCGRES